MARDSNPYRRDRISEAMVMGAFFLLAPRMPGKRFFMQSIKELGDFRR